MKKIKLIAPILGLAALSTSLVPLTSCNKNKEDTGTLSIYGNQIVDKEQTEGLTYYVIGETWQLVECKWSVDDSSIASIDESTGVLTPKKVGSVKVKAVSKADEKQYGTLNVQIVADWEKFKTKWKEADKNFETNIRDKITKAKLKEGSIFGGEEVQTDATIKYNLTSDFAKSNFIITTILGKEKNIPMTPTIEHLTRSISSTLKKYGSIELIMSSNNIGLNVYAGEQLRLSWHFDMNLCPTKIYQTNTLTGEVIDDITILSYE